MKIFFTAIIFALSAASAQALIVESKDITANKTIGNEFIYSGMGCTGKNTSPELHWSGAPKDTKSFAVTVYDPDAPTGSGFWHWVVYNIPANTFSLPKGWKSTGVNGVEITSDFGVPQYGGPCPPPGKPHSYIFTVHALKTEKIDLPPGATNAFARFMIEGSSIQKGTITATYGR
jgi:Raf kinase inhibitor-like YbhB/YbcL family protein